MTVDRDIGYGKIRNFKGVFIIGYLFIRGSFLNGKLPAEIWRTSKGYHLIWRGLDISTEESYRRREMLGDDPNRIRLDKSSPKRIGQVLFSEKKRTYFDDDGSIKEIKESKRRLVYPFWKRP